MNAVSKIFSWLARAAEGQFRPGPYQLPVTGGWLSAQAGQFQNWWQLGYNPEGAADRSPTVEACVSAYAQTIAMCPGSHWRLNDNGGRDQVKTSALSRILRKPNFYQSISDFLLNLTRSLYLDGNAYALALRNDRYEIAELHLMDPNQSRAQLATTGEIFYTLGGNTVIERRIPGALVVPQRDVLHVRLHTDQRRRYPWPLVGMSPLEAAAADVNVVDAMTQQQIQFYLNQARPSAVLSTDLVLDKDQTQELRDRWNEQVRGMGTGGTPILTSGLKVMPWGVPPKDAMIADLAKISDQRIALVYRVPLQILGLGGTPYASTELLMQSWIASGLGFAINHIEEAFGMLFELRGGVEEYVEFDTEALLRSALKDRIDSLARGVQGGIYAPNEARNKEGLPDVKFGDEPRLQAQVVPLSSAGSIPTSPTSPAALAAPAADMKPPDESKPPPAESKANSDDNIQRVDVRGEVRKLFSSAARINRRFAGGVERSTR